MKRVVTMQDISCVGKCSLTVALPILSAMGLETAILPTAVLSTHTGFQGFTFRDLTDDLDGILAHWVNQNFKMEGVYTGYLGSARQVEFVRKLMKTYPLGTHLVDPAMADGGKLYAGFGMDFVEAMKKLCAESDLIVPNLTEACLLTDTPYRDDFKAEEVKDLLKKLADKGTGKVIMTGYSSSEASLGAICYDAEKNDFLVYENEKVSESFHGTGDIFASTLFGALTLGYPIEKAMEITVDFVLECIRQTVREENHNTYGVNFELALGSLIQRCSCTDTTV